jgi:excinuclease UvrABC helicase subunit UvrB
MKEAAKNLDFEAAAELRDILLELKTEDWAVNSLKLS